MPSHERGRQLPSDKGRHSHSDILSSFLFRRFAVNMSGQQNRGERGAHVKGGGGCENAQCPPVRRENQPKEEEAEHQGVNPANILLKRK